MKKIKVLFKAVVIGIMAISLVMGGLQHILVRADEITMAVDYEQDENGEDELASTKPFAEEEPDDQIDIESQVIDLPEAESEQEELTDSVEDNFESKEDIEIEDEAAPGEDDNISDVIEVADDTTFEDDIEAEDVADRADDAMSQKDRDIADDISAEELIELGEEEDIKDQEETESVIEEQEKDDTEQFKVSEINSVIAQYVVNEQCHQIRIEDIKESVEMTQRKNDHKECGRFEYGDTKGISDFIARNIAKYSSACSVICRINNKEFERLRNPDNIAEEIVNQAIKYNRNTESTVLLENLYYGYSYVQNYSVESDDVIINIDYTFISWKNLIQNGESLYEKVMASTYSNPLAEAAYNELVARESEGHEKDNWYYNEKCWGSDNGFGWCAAFVGYCGELIGYSGTQGFMPPKPEYGVPANYSDWYLDKDASVALVLTGSSITASSIQSGDIIVCDNSKPGLYNHVGIVTYVDSNNFIHTIEGNMTNSDINDKHPIVLENVRYLGLANDPEPIVKVVRPNPNHLTDYVRISYDYQGGSGSPAYKFVANYGKYGALPSPTRTGYTFAGWYTSPNSVTRVYSTTDLKQYSNHTLYARWTAKHVTVRYYGYGEGYFSESEYLYQDIFYYGKANQYLRGTSHATTGYYATGWALSGNSWGAHNYDLGNEVWNSWILEHQGETVKLVQTYSPETVTVRYYSYGEGYADNSYYKGSAVYSYGASNKKFWSVSYASPGYYATGWNINCNSWASPNFSLGYVVLDSWIHSHAGMTVYLAQTFAS